MQLKLGQESTLSLDSSTIEGLWNAQLIRQLMR